MSLFIERSTEGLDLLRVHTFGTHDEVEEYLLKHSLCTAVEGKIIFNHLHSCSGPVDPDVYIKYISVFHLYFFVVCFAGPHKLAE